MTLIVGETANKIMLARISSTITDTVTIEADVLNPTHDSKVCAKLSHKNTMRTLIIHNTSSGFGSDAIFEFERALVSAGDECVLRAIGTKHFPITVIDDADEFDVVVLSGGDGTLARFLWELRGRNIPTCIFPSGTSNLFFANISNAPEPAALAAACRAGRTAKTDLGVISWQTVDNVKNDASFSLMAGSGFDAEIMRRAVPQKHALGEAAYFLAAFSNPAPAHVTFTIELDDETVVRSGVACLVANNALMQADAELVPDCRMDDRIGASVVGVPVLFIASLVYVVYVFVSLRAKASFRASESQAGSREARCLPAPVFRRRHYGWQTNRTFRFT